MSEPTSAPDLGALPLFDDAPAAEQALPGAWSLAGPTRGNGPAAVPDLTATGGGNGTRPDTNTTGATPVVPDRPAGPTHNTGRAPGVRPAREVDWALVRAFREQAAKRLSAALSGRPGLDDAQQRALGQDIVVELLSDYVDEAMADGTGIFTPDEQRELAKAVMDALFNLGRLQPLVDKPEVENIEAYGADNVWVEYSDGRLEQVEPVADTDEELTDFLAFLATRSQANERAFSPFQPTLHLRLDGGARLAATAWITPRPIVVIRLHRLRKPTLADLVARGMMSPNIASFLAAAVRAKKSIVVSGPQSVGKTTLMRALCAEIPTWEKIGTAETEFELQLQDMPERHPRLVAWEARPGSGERGSDGKAAGEITLDDIIYDSFRFNLSRLCVGEVRGREVMAMLKAMQGGAGSMSTTHAHSAHAAIERLVTCAMEAGAHVTEQFAYRQVAEHIDLIVQLNLETTGWDVTQPHRARYVTEILAIEPGERDGRTGWPAAIPIYEPGPDGRARPGVLNAEMAALEAYGFDPAGYDRARGGR